MDPVRPSTTSEVLYIIDMIHYYSYMYPSRSCVLSPLIETDSGTKGRKILCNDNLEVILKYLK